VVGAAVRRRERCGRRLAVGRGGCAEPTAWGGAERGGGRARAAVRRGAAGGGVPLPNGGTRRARRTRAPRRPPTAGVGTIGGGVGGRVAGWRTSADRRRWVGWRRGLRWGLPPRCCSGAPAVGVERHGGAGAADLRTTGGGRACGGGVSAHRPRVTATAVGGAAGGAARRHSVGKRGAWRLRQRPPATYGKSRGGGTPATAAGAPPPALKTHRRRGGGRRAKPPGGRAAPAPPLDPHYTAAAPPGLGDRW